MSSHTHADITLRAEYTVRVPLDELEAHGIVPALLVEGDGNYSGADLLDIWRVRDEWENNAEIEIDEAYTLLIPKAAKS